MSAAPTTPPAAASETAFGVYIHWPFCLSKCPVLRLQQPRAPLRHRRGALRARVHRRDRGDCCARAGPDRLLDLHRRRHALADAAGDGCRHARCRRPALARRARRRGHARSQSDQRRSRRVFAATAPPASIAYRSACRRSTIARWPSSDGCTRRARRSTRSPSRAACSSAISFDLIYARPRQTPQDWASELKRALAEAGEHLSLYQLTIEPETPFAALACRRQAQNAGRRHRARALRHDAGGLRRARPARLRDFQSCAVRRRVPAQSHLLAGARICRHRPRRAWARSISTASATPPRRKNAPRHGSRRSRRDGHGLITDDMLTREEMADEFLLMGLRLAEGIDPERYAAIAGRTLDPDRIAALREHDLIETTAAGRLRVSWPDFPCLMRSSPTSRRDQDVDRERCTGEQSSAASPRIVRLRSRSCAVAAK